MQLIWDKADATLWWEGTHIAAAPMAYPPFTCQAHVEEQDTWLVLGQTDVIRDPGKPPWYFANTLQYFKPKPHGSVIISRENTNKLMAVVVDVDAEPICRMEWVLLAYNEVMHVVMKRKFTSLALPLLGTEFGRMSEEESIDCLRDVLEVSHPACLDKLWLVLPAESDFSCLRRLLPEART